ncbi:peptidylprolyl isomerase [Geobacter sp. FeAm09]|uniref:FKBP-type peptidyl-prolyl cis-trans isomerase n=1 Tax=Geobacter sp. FeAm09 TaxID=2597769 RepID=UPI0011ECFFD8|nr:FKBP-type peptidyl-prolyl cis-trans isomerase [Geobacter sp. FeAm09]QEM67650.1 peptidylprolyl isomerase [Geobacter sp. FeAm09]
MAKAKVGDKVRVHYKGTLDDGLIFDYTGEFGHVICAPMELVIGREGEDDLPPKFHEALIGMEPGERVTVRIPCEDAYGEHSEEKVFEMPRSELAPEEEMCEDWRYPNNKTIPPFDPRKGERLEICLPDGTYIPAILTKITESTYTLDANHPWAGKDLTYDIKLVEIV